MTTELAILRRAIAQGRFADEAVLMEQLRGAVTLSAAERRGVEDAAAQLVEAVRGRTGDHSVLDIFLQEFGLGNEEGVALMCLAEALLRIPDADTVDALIADKILPGKWVEHLGQSESAFVNASTWGLLLTGRVLALERIITRSPADALRRLIGRFGEPVIRNAMRGAMRILGAEFVLGRDIDEALARGRKEHGNDAVFSFDMLGEGARTAQQAQQYSAGYATALEKVGVSAATKGVQRGSGVSVKLSALHPRYEYAQRARVMDELYPRLLQLASLAARLDIGLSIDAEETERLEVSLDLFELLCRAPELNGWQGLGLVVQAYGKRAPAVLDWLVALARETNRCIPVRLVKGAYWDAEIKRAQENGLADFAVFTQKANTDVAYLVCAQRLLAAGSAVYPQFATHNAHTLSAVMAIGATVAQCEFQRLHGMGELLYKVAGEFYPGLPQVRIYAPVGGHSELLAYLVRRLLENGANSSFVNRFLDAQTPARDVVRDPVVVSAEQPPRHPAIRLPPALFGDTRQNSAGTDLTDAGAVATLLESLTGPLGGRFEARPSVGVAGDSQPREIHNPADSVDIVGTVEVATPRHVETAFALAVAAQPAWDARGGVERARILGALAEQLEAARPTLVALLVREAGKTIVDALAEIREAVDFCRYYAALARTQFGQPLQLTGPTGETNELSLHGRGVFVCISPWNFPLAIFVGQLAAALAAGNCVLAKPAPQTPLIAMRAVQLAHAAGVPAAALSVLPGAAGVGAAVVGHRDVAGVAFTGSTATAVAINRALAARDGAIAVLIAETGGQNAMFVDSTALLEQLTDDVIRSAFGSAGQRCSALRLLLLQEEVADAALQMIRGAMTQLCIGDPAQLRTDLGPLIDARAVSALRAHIDAMRARGCRVTAQPLPESCANGSFLAPHLIELDSLDALTQEHFGPVLHVLRYEADALDEMLDAVRALGYGLTLGVHSRIDARARHIFKRSSAGNTYVNRNMIGAVVGVQPFGGQGLSGTGPKAGGPHYLLRFALERTLTVNTMARGGNIELLRGA